MAETRVPSVLWNVTQSLSKTEMETARTNIGVNTLIHSGGTHKFLTKITENSSTGVLSVSSAQPVIGDITDLEDTLDGIQDDLDTHVHGSILHDGTITDVSNVTSNDALLIATASGNAIKKSNIKFGTDETLYLTKKGTWKAPLSYYYINQQYTPTTDSRGNLTIGSSYFKYIVNLDGTEVGHLVPSFPNTSSKCVLLYDGSNSTYDWSSNVGLTLYELPADSNNFYSANSYDGMHLGDGFGSGYESTYNGHKVPTNGKIAESLSITMSKIGIQNGPESSSLVGYYNDKKITNSSYKSMLAGGAKTGTHQYGSSYITSIDATYGEGYATICRIPPYHWGLISLSIKATATTGYNYTTSSEFDCKLISDSSSCSVSMDTSSLNHGIVVYADSSVGYAQTTFLAFNHTTEVKAVKFAIASIPSVQCSTSIYKQFIIFKTPEDGISFNLPDETVWP
jgi:hypothetical protein